MTQFDLENLQREFETKTAWELLHWTVNTFGEKIAFANSFGAEDVVLMDVIAKVNWEIKIFTLDTGRLPQETYEVWEQLKGKYKMKIIPYFPDTSSVEKMLNEYGPNLFYKSIELRKLCCQIRKVEPLERALNGLEAWICGLRREQAITRSEIKKIEVDKMHKGILKICPLADWSERQIWDYIKENHIPYNTLHDKNYPSIGCAPCTRAIEPGEDIRAGRWWWELPENKECGLHGRK